MKLTARCSCSHVRATPATVRGGVEAAALAPDELELMWKQGAPRAASMLSVTVRSSTSMAPKSSGDSSAAAGVSTGPASRRICCCIAAVVVMASGRPAVSRASRIRKFSLNSAAVSFSVREMRSRSSETSISSCLM